MNDAAPPRLRASADSVIPEPGRHSFRSTRLHMVLLRFGMISLASSVVDNAVFYLVFHGTGTILGAQVVGRVVSVSFNYFFVRKSVFFSDHSHGALLPRYLLLAGANAAVSYVGIRLLSAYTPLGVMLSKIVTETMLFAANFLIQRAFVFTRRTPDQASAKAAGR